MKIEKVKTDKIIPYVNNAKIHTDEQVDLIAGSIKEFGFINPIILSKDNEIIAGHGRFMAAKKLGLKEVPVIRAEDLTPAQIKAYRLADNRLAELADWAPDLLMAELGELEELDFDTELIGFDEMDIARLLELNSNGDEDVFGEVVSAEAKEEITKVELFFNPEQLEEWQAFVDMQKGKAIEAALLEALRRCKDE